MLITILVIISSSCSSIKTCDFQPLPLPPAIQESDVLTQSDLQCIDDKTLNKIILLDKRRKTLEEIIKSTHK